MLLKLTSLPPRMTTPPPAVDHPQLARTGQGMPGGVAHLSRITIETGSMAVGIDRHHAVDVRADWDGCRMAKPFGPA